MNKSEIARKLVKSISDLDEIKNLHNYATVNSTGTTNFAPTFNPSFKANSFSIDKNFSITINLKSGSGLYLVLPSGLICKLSSLL